MCFDLPSQVNVASHYAKDWTSAILNSRSPKSLQPGEAVRAESLRACCAICRAALRRSLGSKQTQQRSRDDGPAAAAAAAYRRW